ncbi:MAG TPA: flagellar motor switch protein FliM [Geobacteraceae bacterium]|nr:flagellar motor switch protein FliM [Geobacteraceae bacterium]
MKKILTREEIDALLNDVAEGRIDPEKELAREQGGVVNYDLFNTMTHKGMMPNLDIVYDSFIRSYRVTMSNRLRRIVEIKKVGARPFKFDDFILSLPSPVCMGIYKIEPLKGAAMVAMDSQLVFAVMDSILGGTGSPRMPENNRMFTSIELRIMQKIVKDALIDMEKAWAPLHGTRMTLLRMEMNPRLVNLVPPEYHVVTMQLEIQIENTKGTMIFVVPYMTVEPIRDKLKNGVQFDLVAVDSKWSYRLSAELNEAPLEVTVEMGNTMITLEELMNLAPGDTIMLEKECRSELMVKVGGVAKYMGVPGVRSGNKAVQITRIIRREDEGE